MIASVLVGLAVAWLTWSMTSMESHYRRAVSMDIPLVRVPVDPNNALYLVLEEYIWRLLNLFPFTFGNFARYSRRGWHFIDKAESHIRYGPAWAIVHPGGIFVHVADPDAIRDIFARRQDFQRPNEMYKLLEVYGPCISTASWNEWPRHRKVLAAPFNENIMTLVWDESLKQTFEMIDTWTGSRKDSEHAIPSVSKDTRTLSLNVLAATGFRRSYKFHGAAEPQATETKDYRDSLQMVLDNAIFLMLVSYRLLLLPLPFIPASWTRIGKAARGFRDFMAQMLEQETSALEQGESGSGGLMTSFVRALRTHETEETKEAVSPSSRSKGLSVDEIFGNIFVINFAGHDTTANTLAFAVLLLAANPEVQDWVAEELKNVLPSSDRASWIYESTFPQCRRCRAVLLETLRLYPPIMSLPKWSNNQPQTLPLGDRSLNVPPNTGVMPSLLAIQTLPKYWPDPLVWKPYRWISHSAVDPPKVTNSLHEELIESTPNTYFPWSDGPQNCPGEKFAQVEFVAVLAALLQEHRLQVIPRDGETNESARKRCLEATQDCDMQLLLRMKDAKDLKIALVRA